MLRATSFANNTRLEYLHLGENQVTLIEPGALSSTSLHTLHLNGNGLTIVPPAIHQIASTLVYLALTLNDITEITRADFAGMTALRAIRLADNPVLRVETGTFQELTALNIPPEDFAPFLEYANLELVSSIDLTGTTFGTQIVGSGAIIASGWPRECTWIGPFVNDIECGQCVFGYANNQEDYCEWTPFAVREGFWNRQAYENDPIMGLPDASGTRAIYLRNRLELDPPAPALDPRRGYVGYAAGNYADIKYSLAFPGQVDVSCGHTTIGDSTSIEPVRLMQSTRDQIRSIFFRYNDRPAYLRLEVLTAGNITIDTCESLYGTSMAVYRGWGPAAYNDYNALVGYDVMTPNRSDFSRLVPWMDWHKLNVSMVSGCVATQSARRTVYLDAGQYTVRIRSVPADDDAGGTYVVKLECSDGASTRSVSDNNPGGLLVNPTTGAISGTPQRLGDNYTMELIAVDGELNQTTVASWQFSVRERVFETTNWTMSSSLDASRGILPRYHVGEVHTIAAPPDKTTIFANPANDDFDAIVFLLLVNGTSCDNDPAAFVNVVTGAGVFNVSCPGQYTATLKARDDAGFEAIVNQWNFEARLPDTALAANGPNGVGCANGNAIDENPMDNTFTCDCGGTAFSGPNCASKDDGKSGMAVESIVAISFVVIVILALAVSRYQLHRARNRPEDLDDLQDEVLGLVGFGTLKVSKNEIGLMLQFEEPPDDPDGVLSSILEAIQGLPRQIVKLVRHKDTEVRLAPSMPYALLAAPKPATLKPGTIEDMAAVLLEKAFSGTFHVNGKKVVDVAVALAKQVPAEVDRRRVVRLEVLGEGHYGEVFKATLSQSGSAALTVAVKSLKKGDSEGAVRENLLREAALMSLCDNRNVVMLIGVVTIPRNMPPLLLIEYCEHGTLLGAVRNTADMDRHLLLTFCHDVASGLHYLGSRRIVHRDVAARNVLLDAAFTAKVSDLGMSAAVVGESDDYASNYIKTHGELPVRWSAIEVLQHGKYSRASDVWAFGILVYEVMSRGTIPYSQFATLAEVTEQIKGGFQLPCPPDCPPSVYEKVMLPCWNPEEVKRPGFSALCKALQSFGVTVDNVPHVEDTRFPANFASTVQNQIQDRSLLGPSVKHLRDHLLPETQTRVAYPWRDKRGELVSPEAATISHAVEVFVRPCTVNTKCPRDNKIGCAYVDVLSGLDEVGSATALLSYTWQYRVQSIVDALVRWVKISERNPEQTYIWICSLCLNQHRMTTIKSSDELANEFRPRVLTIGRILPMLEPWDNAIYLTRAWCLFELYVAIGEHVKIDVILSETQHAQFEKAMTNVGYTAIDQAFQKIQSENATATRQEDLEAIRALVQQTPGGFEQLNATVRHHLAQWFVDQGAIRQSTRVATARKSASLGGSGNSDGFANSGGSVHSMIPGKYAVEETFDGIDSGVVAADSGGSLVSTNYFHPTLTNVTETDI